MSAFCLAILYLTILLSSVHFQITMLAILVRWICTGNRKIQTPGDRTVFIVIYYRDGF